MTYFPAGSDGIVSGRIHFGSLRGASLLFWVHAWNLVEIAIAKRFTPNLRRIVGLQAIMNLTGS